MEEFFRPLNDDPSSIDELGLGFDLLSTHLADLINKSSGGLSIGLLGKWGSGKSSVVKMLEEKIVSTESSNCSLLFKYDAWIHENDYLRRAFLESLVSFLTNNDWISKENWQEKLEVLAGRRIERKVDESTLQFSFTLAIFVALIFLLKLAQIVSLETIPTESWICLAIALLISVVICTFKSFEIKKSTTIIEQTGDITSLEFEKAYTDLIHDALKNENRRLVICIDNLDRLETDHFQKLWSVMRMFTEYRREFGSKETFQRLWVVVPLDRTKLKNYLQHSFNNLEIDKNEKNCSSAEENFVSKTFQMIVEVPPALSASGRQFLKNLLKHVLGGAYNEQEENGEIDLVVALYRALKQESGWNICPRESKLFINSVGFYFFRWQKKIPLSTITAYLFWREQNIDWQNLFFNATSPDPSIAQMLSETWHDDIISLYFNSPASNVKHMLVGRIIDQSLNSNVSPPYLAEASKFEEFEQILEEEFLSHKRILDDDLWKLTFGSRTLTVLEKSNTKLNLSRCWLKLRKYVITIKNWYVLNSQTGTACANILRKLNEHEFSTVTEAVLMNLSDNDSEISEPEFWLSGLEKLFEPIREKGKLNLISEKFHLPQGLNLSSYLSCIKKELISADFAEVIKPLPLRNEYYSKKVTDDSYSKSDYEVIKHSLKFWPEFELENLATVLCNKIMNTASTTSFSIYVSTLLLFRRKYKFVEESLKSFCERDAAYFWVNSDTATNIPLFFSIVFHYLPDGQKKREFPGTSMPSTYFEILLNPSKFPQMINNIANFADSEGFFSDWLLSEVHCSRTELMMRLIEALISVENNLDFLPFGSLIQEIRLPNLHLSKNDFEKISSLDSLKKIDLSGARFDPVDLKLPIQIERVLISEHSLDSLTMNRIRKECPAAMLGHHFAE